MYKGNLVSSKFLVTEWLLVTFLVYSQVPPHVCRSDFCEFEYLRYEFTHAILETYLRN